MPEPQVLNLEEDDLFDYDKAKIRIDNVIDSWSTECRESEQRRKERYVDIDIESLREGGELEPDETLIPDRVIDTNIMREIPEFLAFLKQSNRLAIFDCISNPNLDSQLIEREFTKGLTYKGWYCAFKRLLDGAMLHGTDAIEVIFDETKPLHVAFEHIGHDKLFYNRKVASIQDSELVIRKYEVSMLKLESFKDKGFDVSQIEEILKANTSKRKRDEVTCIYKVYFKTANIVFIGWYSKETNIHSWLKPPEPLRLGIADHRINPMNGASVWNDRNLDIYPIFLYIYREDEQQMVTVKKGRGFLDMPQQEAQTSIISGYVNGLMRATNVYASPATDDGESADVKQLDIELQHGAIYSKPLNFFHTDYPDVQTLSALQFLNTLNAQQTGKTAYAVSNRKDARKTATELGIAHQEERQLESIGLSEFSEFLREILSFSWIVVQSQALQGKIKFMLIEVPIMVPNPVDGTPIPSGETQFVNNAPLISEEFDIRPAGDVDYIERNNKIFQMKQDWSVISATPLASKFLQDMIQLSYPDKADEYIKILQQGDIGKSLVASLGTLLQAFTSREDLASLAPQELDQLKQIQTQAKAYLGNETIQSTNQTAS